VFGILIQVFERKISNDLKKFYFHIFIEIIERSWIGCIVAEMDISDKDIASYLLGGQAASDQGLDQKFDFNFGRSVFTGLFADFQMREQIQGPQKQARFRVIFRKPNIVRVFW
jgi:hypothetical protein